jgi:hypothetical protein
MTGGAPSLNLAYKGSSGNLSEVGRSKAAGGSLHDNTGSSLKTIRDSIARRGRNATGGYRGCPVSPALAWRGTAKHRGPRERFRSSARSGYCLHPLGEYLRRLIEQQRLDYENCKVSLHENSKPFTRLPREMTIAAGGLGEGARKAQGHRNMKMSKPFMRARPAQPWPEQMRLPKSSPLAQKAIAQAGRRPLLILE